MGFHGKEERREEREEKREERRETCGSVSKSYEREREQLLSFVSLQEIKYV